MLIKTLRFTTMCNILVKMSINHNNSPITAPRTHSVQLFQRPLSLDRGRFVRGIHRSPVNSPHKGQWRGALMFPLICVWINGWVNNREAGDLRRYRAHYDVIVMLSDVSQDEWVPRAHLARGVERRVPGGIWGRMRLGIHHYTHHSRPTPSPRQTS